MGSTPDDMVEALVLCRREILHVSCDAIGPSLRAEGHAHRVTVGSFSMDRSEVTVGAYQGCVRGGYCAPPAFSPGDRRFDRDEFPVTHVGWDDAVAYCRHVGGRLATEAQWEFAARGTFARTYPWGNVYNPRLCNHGAFAPDETDGTDGFIGLAPVGALRDGATPLGIVDLAGNVSEWVLDTLELDGAGFGYGAEAVTDPQPKRTGPHVVRGGSYLDGAPWMRAASRGVMGLPRSPSVGFRCVYSDTH
jgi:formylglycine-generating enzyme required for sulfatase activity